MLGQILKNLRRERGISQKKLAELLNLGQSTVSMWEKGKNFPEHSSLLKLSEIFNVSIDYLTGQGCGTASFKIPVLGYVRAGLPTQAYENVLDYVDISLTGENAEDYFALRIRGDSMCPRMMEGDTVIVKKQSDCENGDVCVALVGGSDATVKKIIKKDNGIVLMPLNPAYDPIIFTIDDTEKTSLSIIGKVVELRAKI